MPITDEQNDALNACARLKQIEADGFSNGLWGRTSSAPYPVGTPGHEHWNAGHSEGAQRRFELLGYWGPER